VKTADELAADDVAFGLPDGEVGSKQEIADPRTTHLPFFVCAQRTSPLSAMQSKPHATLPYAALQVAPGCCAHAAAPMLCAHW
jgi:hypothetical protein